MSGAQLALAAEHVGVDGGELVGRRRGGDGGEGRVAKSVKLGAERCEVHAGAATAQLLGLRDLDDAREGRRVAHADVGQDLAVEPHAGVLEAADELAVGDAVEPGGGVQADDPQARSWRLRCLRPR